MGTPFSKIYEMFLADVKSYDFYDMTDEELEDELVTLLESAVAYFGMYARNDSLEETDFTDSNGYFDEKLTLLEQKILAKYMTLSYISMHYYNLEETLQVLNSKDYRVYSERNFVDARKMMKESAEKEINRLLSRYSYVALQKRRKK